MGKTAGHRKVAIGDVVEGRYRILGTLGEGGMGTVFLAEHVLIRRRVAIKVLHAELATDAHVVARFMNEARAAGTLGHPNIVESTDMGFTHEQVPYIVFEYLEGTLLTDEIYRVGGLAVRRAVRIAQQIASAVHAAHRADIIHRDLKSDNIFLTDRLDAPDHVKVLDFGISRFLETRDESIRRGMVVGTPEFMAPEQIIAPEHVDARTDIYGLGVILYEMLTARRPFGGLEPLALLDRIVSDAPPPITRADVPRELADLIVNTLLAKCPDDRLPSMLDVDAALDRFTTPARRADSADDFGRARKPRSSDREERVDDFGTCGMDAELAAAERERGSVDDFGAREIDFSSSDRIPLPVRAHETPSAGIANPLRSLTVAVEPRRGARTPRAWHVVVAGVLAVAALGFVGRGGDDGASAMVPTPVMTPVAPAAAVAPPPPKREPAKVAVQITAAVANARVTFRRRVAPAPLELAIAPNDIVELVEVSAPGHKSTRYWITFDRATALAARLERGTGLIEASEEQTLIALGEIAAPSPPVAKIEAPKPAAAARKIGRVDAVAVAVEPAPAIVHDEPAPPAVAIAAVTTTADPTVEPNPPDTQLATSAPRASEPIAPPAIDRPTLAAVVGKNRPAVLACLATGKQANPKLAGTLTVRLDVGASGSVDRAQVRSTLAGASTVAACVAKAVRGWRFPARTDRRIASIEYPFVIH